MALDSNFDVSEMFAARESQRSAMHTRYLNEQFVRVLKTIGYDVGFQKGQGQYLYDRAGDKYLDLLSGFGVFAIGRNHPALRQALKSVLDADLPNLVQFDVSTLAGILAERLLEHVPYLDKVFFANSGAETVEAAIKFARGATGRPGIVYCSHAFHGLSYGALSLTDDSNFRLGFEPLLPGCTPVPFNDLAALERALSSKQVAAFIVEPIQGKGVNLPDESYLRAAAELCRKHQTLFIADEVQTGLGRTGRILACDHEGVRPDGLTLGKALGGGLLPVSAFCAREDLMAVFNPGDHGSTFGGNPLGAAVGETALTLLEHGPYCETARVQGDHLLARLRALDHPAITDIRGKGLLVGVEIDPAFAGARRVCDALVDEGVLTKDTHGTVVRMAPPLTIAAEQIDQAVAALGRALASIEAAEPVAA